MIFQLQDSVKDDDISMDTRNDSDCLRPYRHRRPSADVYLSSAIKLKAYTADLGVDCGIKFVGSSVEDHNIIPLSELMIMRREIHHLADIIGSNVHEGIIDVGRHYLLMLREGSSGETL